MDLHLLAYLASFITVGSFVIIDLIAATTNALNGALLAQRPDYYKGKQWSVVGIIILAIFGGIGGGVSRDVLLNKIPGALTNPWYLILCVLAGIVGMLISFKGGQKFRETFYQFMTAFSLPWYAAIGVAAALAAGLPDIAAVAIGVVGPTAGRFLIDITAGKSAKQFVRGEWFVGTAVLTSLVYLFCVKYSGADPMAGDPDFLCRGLPLPPRGDLVLLGRAAAAGSRRRQRGSQEAHHPEGEDAAGLGTRVRLRSGHPFESRKDRNMTLADFFEAIAKISGLLFVVTSMLAMGLSLTVPMILQPLKNVRLVILALLANFVLVPLLAYLITLIIPLEAVAQGWVDRAGYCGGRALPAQVGAGRQGERRLRRRADGAVDGGDHHLHAARAAAAAAGCVGESVGHRQVVDRADARAAGARPADQIAFARHRRPLAAGDGEGLQPGHPRPAGGGTGTERLQSHRPDRHGRSPGAAAVHRRVAADRPPAGWPRCRQPQRDGAGHGAAQCVGRPWS